MSTRALYTFTDEHSSWNVYKHHDGYPEGAADTLNDAVNHFAWTLPRFEANEFATAFCAAAKAYRMVQVIEGETSLEVYKVDTDLYARWSKGGGVRLMPQGDPRDVAQNHCSDVEYRYEVIHAPDGGLWVKAYTVSAWEHYEEERIFSGAFDAFIQWSKQKENA